MLIGLDIFDAKDVCLKKKTRIFITHSRINVASFVCICVQTCVQNVVRESEVFTCFVKLILK